MTSRWQPSTLGRPLSVGSAPGAATFVPIGDYDWVAMKRWRGAANAIVELAVDHAVPDIAGMVLRVERRRQNEATQVLWERVS
jgi:hypothetical protein